MMDGLWMALGALACTGIAGMFAVSFGWVIFGKTRKRKLIGAAIIAFYVLVVACGSYAVRSH